MKVRRSRSSFIGCVLVLAALAAPAAAAAAVTCAYDSGLARVTISMPAVNDVAAVKRSGNAIHVEGTGLVLAPCGAATVRNTNRINVSGPGAVQQFFTIDLSGGPFAPGKTRESTGVSEIEIYPDLGASTDQVRVVGSEGNDVVRLGSGGAGLNADQDADVFPTGVDDWVLEGRGGADSLSAAGGRGTASAFGLRLDIYGGTGKDVLTGSVGDDYLDGMEAADVLNGGGGADSLTGRAGHDRLSGGDGSDSLWPGAGADVMEGGAGADQFIPDAGGDGRDEFRGGPGRDAAAYYPRTGTLTISLDNRANDGLAGERDNIRSDVEIVYGGGGADTLTGSSQSNVLDGGAGGDVVNGGGDDDTLYGGFDAGADTLRGGAGNDLLFSGDGPDVLDGGPGEDEFRSDLGNDTVLGGAGNDSVYEHDVSSGADVLVGGPGTDILNYSGRTAGITFKLDGLANDGASGGVEGDNIGGDFEVFYGGSGADAFTGDARDSWFYGAAGVDSISGGAGADRLFGGAGGDTITGGEGTDTHYGEADNDTLNAIDGGFDFVYGGPGADVCNADAFDSKQDCP